MPAVRPTPRQSSTTRCSAATPQLDPEESDTLSFGFVFTPTFVNGLQVSLDYYDIDVQDAITFIDPDTTLTVCIELALNSRIRPSRRRGYVVARHVNPEQRHQRLVPEHRLFPREGLRPGGDLHLRHRPGRAAWCSPIGSATSTRGSRKSTRAPVSQECVGAYGGSCNLPTAGVPQQLHDDVGHAVGCHAQPDVALYRRRDRTQGECHADRNISSQDYFDLAGSWNVADFVTLEPRRQQPAGRRTADRHRWRDRAQ